MQGALLQYQVGRLISHMLRGVTKNPQINSFKKSNLKGEKRGDFPGDLVIEKLPANAGDMGSLSSPGRLHMLRGI